jgi:O-antigen ligase
MRKARMTPSPRTTPHISTQSSSHKYANLQTIALILAVLGIIITGFGAGALYDHPPAAADYTSYIQSLILPSSMLISALSCAILILIHKPTRHLSLSSIFMLLFILWCAFTVAHGIDLQQGVWIWCQFAYALMIGYAIFRLAETSGSIEIAIAPVVFTTAIQALYGALEYAGHFSTGDRSWRVFGNFINPDFLAGQMLMGIPLTLFLFLHSDFKRNNPFSDKSGQYLLLPIVAIILFMSGLMGTILNMLHAGIVLSFLLLLSLAGILALGLVLFWKVKDKKDLGGRLVTILYGFALVMESLCLLLTQSRFGIAALILALFIIFLYGLWMKAFRHVSSHKIRTLGIAIVLICFLGAKPVFKRLELAGDQSYSLLFREYTWRGTLHMIKAHPFMGTGLGSYVQSYQPYALVGYTQHAHNSFLQLASETGIPGFLLFFLCVGVCIRPLISRVNSSDAANSAILKTGFLGALLAAFIHNLTDGDLYIPANMIVFAAICGTSLAFSTMNNPNADPSAAPQKKHLVHYRHLLLLFPVIFIVLFTYSVLMARIAVFNAETAIQQRDYTAALADYRTAASWNPLNVDFQLKIAGLYAADGHYTQSDDSYRKALQIAPTAKAYYLYGRFLQKQGRNEEAEPMFLKASVLDPHNLENLIALAESLKANRKISQAADIYRRITEISLSPVGKIRAIPELPDWEYGVAWLGLAEISLDKGDLSSAENQLQTGSSLLQDFLKHKKEGIFNITINADIKTHVEEKYLWSMEQLLRFRKQENRNADVITLQNQIQDIKNELQSTGGNQP